MPDSMETKAILERLARLETQVEHLRVMRPPVTDFSSSAEITAVSRRHPPRPLSEWVLLILLIAGIGNVDSIVKLASLIAR